MYDFVYSGLSVSIRFGSGAYFLDRIYRIFGISFFIFSLHLPAIAGRSGEAGGEETENTQSPPANKM